VSEMDLDRGLEELNKGMKIRNDPLIKQSRKVLWTVRGEKCWKRRARDVAIWWLELKEKMSGQRARAERELAVAKLI